MKIARATWSSRVLSTGLVVAVLVALVMIRTRSAKPIHLSLTGSASATSTALSTKVAPEGADAYGQEGSPRSGRPPIISRDRAMAVVRAHPSLTSGFGKREAKIVKDVTTVASPMS